MNGPSYLISRFWHRLFRHAIRANPRTKEKRTPRVRSRHLRLENLEDRSLLSTSWPGLLIHDSSGDIFTVAFRDGWNLNRVGHTPVQLFDTAFSPSGQLFGIGGPIGSASQLYTLGVNFSSYAPVDLQLVGTVRAGGSALYLNSLEFGPDGLLYAAGYDPSGVNAIFRVDPSTASAVALVILGGHRPAGDLEFDEFGNAYVTTEGSRLIRVDLTTRSYHEVGWIVFSDFYGLAYGPGPILHGFRSNGEVYRINPETAAISFVTRLSHPNLSSVFGAAMIYPGPLDLGAVEFMHRPNEPIVLQEMWYRVQTVRDALFTVETYGGSSGTKVTLYQRQPDGSLTQLADVFRRLDYSVSGPTTFYVQIHRTGTVLNTRIANVYKPVGNGAVIYGTAGDDSFVFQPGSTYVMTINGLSYSSSFDSRRLVEVLFDGGAGTDQVTLAGSTQWETVTIDLEEGTAALQAGNRYAAQVVNAEKFTFTGGGGLDAVSVRATSGADQIELAPRVATITSPGGKGAEISAAASIVIDALGGVDSVRFAGSAGDDEVTIRPQEAVLRSPASASDIKVLNAENFDISGGLGSDRITIFGGEGPDEVEVRWDNIRWSGVAYLILASGFEDVTLYGNPGHQDFVKLYSKGGVIDVFQLEPRQASVEGGGRQWQAFGFDRTEVYGNSYENDRAILRTGPPNPVTLTATSTYATVSGSGYSLRAASVRQVEVYGSASDRARYYDGPGDDVFEAQDHVTKMTYGRNPDHYVQSFGFGLVTAYAPPATGGSDVALWQGVPGQFDTFYAKPREATLFGTGYRFWAVDFELVQATGQASDRDIAYLIDSDGNDVFYYRPASSHPEESTALVGTTRNGWNFANRAIGFAQTYVYSTTGGMDSAYMFDSPAGQDTFTATRHYAVMSGPNHYARAWGFERVFAYASSDGFANTARLYTSGSGDFLEIRASSARLEFGQNPLLTVVVTGFRYTTAFSQGGEDIAYFYGFTGVNDTFTAWLSTRTAVREIPSVYYRTVGFRRVVAFGDWGESDRAIVYDSPGNDHLSANGLTAPHKAFIQSLDLVLELQDFGLVRAVSSLGGTDTRSVLHRANLSYVLEDIGPWVDG